MWRACTWVAAFSNCASGQWAKLVGRAELLLRKNAAVSLVKKAQVAHVGRAELLLRQAAAARSHPCKFPIKPLPERGECPDLRRSADFSPLPTTKCFGR